MWVIVFTKQNPDPNSLINRHAFIARIVSSAVTIVLIASTAMGKQNSNEKYAFEITRRVDFEPAAEGYSELRVDLGEIPAQGKGRVLLLVRNASDREVNLGDSFSGCSCLNVSLSNPRMAPGGECEIELIFSV